MIASRVRADRSLVMAVGLVLFLAAFLRTAWIGDDAYITFRTIDNFLNGYGLRWNVAERVQSYTHPLWLLLLIPVHWAAGEPYFSTLALSIVLSLFVVRGIARLAPSVPAAVGALVILLFSRAFLDYATSGLENPLSNLLVVGFLGVWLRPAPSPFVLSLIAALVMMTRLDLVLLVAPALAVACVRVRAWKQPVFLAGFLPLIAWELFSILYYGFPFPNTAYAKLGMGIPTSELIPQGLLYLVDSLQRDPVTLSAIAAALIAAAVRPSVRTWPIAAGVVAYLVYVVRVGGDFMSGRFLVAPLVASIVALVATDWRLARQVRWAPAVVLVAALAAFAPNPMPQQGGDAAAPELVGRSGVADERLWYFATSGLVNYRRDGQWPADPSADRGRQARLDGTKVLSFCCVGTMGYFAGPGVHVIDEAGLADPLLARLPSRPRWRIGHFIRDIPEGYVESVETGENRVKDPGIAAYYARIRTVTRDPVLSGARLRTVVRMNMGQYESFLDGVRNGDDERNRD